MILFLLGFSLCLNIILILIGLKLYKKFIPVFRSTGIDINSIDSFWSDL